ncbi:MAG: tetratricopeptide repeat protein [Rhodospirillales bacterium]|nr:tetratricopeptide repeat protein [Rhodospirillales bacterium]MDP6774322.1 tetratricopeptide repeat protein [Rhodospirillales bacterium]
MSKKKHRKGRGSASGGAGPPSIEVMIGSAWRLLREGSFTQARGLAEGALELVSDHAEALHILGLADLQAGRTEKAVDLIGQAIAADDSDPSCHSNLAVALNRLGRGEEAEAASRRAVELRADYADGHVNLGLSLENQGRLEDAEAAFRRAIEAAPGHVNAHNNLGNVLRRRGELDAAIGAYHKAVALQPRFAMAQSNLGAALREAGRLKEAMAHCTQAVRLDPRNPEAQNSLGNVRMATGDTDGAIASFEIATSLEPNFTDAHFNMASAFFVKDELGLAEAAYERVLAIDPGHAPAHNGLGVVWLAAGRLEDAVASFRRAVGLKADYVEAWYNLASSRSAELTGAETTALETLLEGAGLHAVERARLHFTLGEIGDAGGEAEAAFGHFREGNALRQSWFEEHGLGFDAGEHDAWLEGIAKAFGKEAFTAARTSTESSEVPVFIVGMPRSGTTLVEHIAASHGGVFGAGELDAVGFIAAGLGEAAGAAGPFPEGVAALETAAANDLSRPFLEHLVSVGRGTHRVIDKTPDNFLYLGLIALLFPKARIIHCRRDARDVCLSCYFTDFAGPRAWATDLGDLGLYHRAYEMLMEHWRKVLPLPILEVRYEALVDGLEEESRRVIDFLGLEWDDACLAFHETERTVRSASNWQVRKPVHSASVGRWQAYEKFLGPLKEALGAG